MKIFITYASAGGGHKKAAESIYRAFRELAPQEEVILADSLDYTNKFFKWFYVWFYLFLVNKAPLLWGFSYYITDWFYPVFMPFRRFSNFMNSKRFVEFISNSKFDVVISAHFFSTEVISNMKKKGQTDAKLVTIVTDYGLHATWVSKYVDEYIVASESTKGDLINRGIPAEKITVLGIPVEKKFSLAVSRPQSRTRLGLSADKFCVLIVGGGFGVGPIEELTESLGELDPRIELIIVCGKNEELYTKIKNLTANFKTKTIVYQFTENMDELMSAADVIITKPGGLSTSEALSKMLPIMSISPILGQETKNCDLLVENKAAVCINDAGDAKRIILGFLNSPDTLNDIRENIKKISRPNSSSDIAKFVLSKFKK